MRLRCAVLLAVVVLAIPAAPLAAKAQQVGKAYRIGVLGIASMEAVAPYQRALEAAFRELGYVPGQNILLEYRFAGGDPDRLRQFAS